MFFKGLSVFITLFLFASESLAQTPKERVPGVWVLKHIRGAYCARQVDDLEYYFGKDGRYEVRAKMVRTGGINKEAAKGTYVANDETITAKAEGYTLGPHRYRFEGETMVMIQNPPGCNYYFERED